ncbi:MAG: SRPBCC domain-containing protein [Chloroflexota bacterium]
MFKALGDASRRLLLDRLFERDGQTLGELCDAMGMTRFGVMKHLRVLEDAGLVTTRRHGREKLHYLNPVPIRLLHDRWISKFAEPWVERMSNLKSRLEAPMKPPAHVYEVYIRTTPERLWEALTTPELSQQYYYGTLVSCGSKVGDPISYRQPDGKRVIEGEILELEHSKRLVHTFRFSQGTHGDGGGDAPSRVSFSIDQMGDVCKLTLTHDQFEGETETYKSVRSGWNPILSGLKTLLETGAPLEIRT